MIFTKGDKVKFLNEVGRGEVVEIIDDQMVMIETQDGFRVPYLISELIPEGNLQPDTVEETIPEVFPQAESESDFQNQTIISKVKKEKRPENSDVFLALVSQFMADKMELNVYLINMSSYHILFHIGIHSGTGLKTIAFDELETDEKIFIGPLPEIPGETLLRIRYQMIFFKNELFQLLEPLSGVINLDNETLLTGGSFSENDFFEEKAMLFPLISAKRIKFPASEMRKYALEKGDIKFPASKKASSSGAQSEKVEEIDLHANAIIDHPAGLGPAEILEMQIARFEIAMEGAIRHKQKKIIFIHGKGEGKLKHRIQKIIEEKYPGLKYQDASFKEYGYGATLVILR